MGRTTKWLRSLFSSSRKPPPEPEPPQAKERSRTRWSLPKSAELRTGDGQLDANKHAIAVAAATAAVAEAALAAAQAAAEVVRLTRASGSARNDAVYISADRRRVVAAVRIQSAFRAYLARRALRALKGLVKLQALVRGHIVRKQSADMLRRMQAMARIQARASAHRSEPAKFEYSHHPGTVNGRNYHQNSNNAKLSGSIPKQCMHRPHNSKSLKTESSHQPSNWLHHWMDEYAWNDRRIDDDRTDKILEIDTWKPHQPTRQSDRTTIPTSQYSSAWNDMARHTAKLQKPNPSISSEEVFYMVSPKGDQGAVCTAENSPRVHSASSRPTRGPFTPTRSEYSRSLFGDYLSHPNYMANTESSRAKVRSQSAPKQRMQMEELGMSHGLWEPDVNSEKGFALPGNNYRGTPYLPNLGHLRRQGTPACGAYTGLGSTYSQRL